MTSTDPAVAPIRLWEGVAPGSADWTHDEQSMSSADGAVERVRNVVVPTMTAYLPDEPTDRAVLVLPGGAMHFLSMESEGSEVATFLRDRGVPTFVVKYRLVPTPPDDVDFDAALVSAFGSGIDAMMRTAVPLAVADAERATTIVHERGFTHVTMLGFSAGASVTAELIATSTHPPTRLRSSTCRSSPIGPAWRRSRPCSWPRRPTIRSASTGRSRSTPRGGPPAARSSSTSSNAVVTGSACRGRACRATSGRSCSWPGCSRSETRSADQSKRDSRSRRIAHRVSL